MAPGRAEGPVRPPTATCASWGVLPSEGSYPAPRTNTQAFECLPCLRYPPPYRRFMSPTIVPYRLDDGNGAPAHAAAGRHHRYVTRGSGLVFRTVCTVFRVFTVFNVADADSGACPLLSPQQCETTFPSYSCSYCVYRFSCVYLTALPSAQDDRRRGRPYIAQRGDLHCPDRVGAPN